LRLVAHRQRCRPRLCGWASPLLTTASGTPPNCELRGRGLQRALNVNSGRPWRKNALMVYIVRDAPRPWRDQEQTFRRTGRLSVGAGEGRTAISCSFAEVPRFLTVSRSPWTNLDQAGADPTRPFLSPNAAIDRMGLQAASRPRFDPNPRFTSPHAGGHPADFDHP